MLIPAGDHTSYHLSFRQKNNMHTPKPYHEACPRNIPSFEYPTPLDKKDIQKQKYSP